MPWIDCPLFSLKPFSIHAKAILEKIDQTLADLQPIVEALPSLSAYQEFRLQVPYLSSEALKIFAITSRKR